MKSTVVLALAIGLGIMFFFYRRRLKLAITVAGILYLLLTVARLIMGADDTDRLESLGLALGVLAAVWLLTNLVTSFVERRRRRRVRR